MITSQVLLRLHFCEHALWALVATHPTPDKLRACLEETFSSALSPEAAPAHLQQREAFYKGCLSGSKMAKKITTRRQRYLSFVTAVVAVGSR